MKSHVWRYYLISSLFCAARMGIGATAVVYMLNSGASLSDVAITKIVQAFVVFFAEVPTGLIADTFGRRSSLYFAAITSLLSFAVFGVSTTVVGFAMAEVLNGLCIAFWSGAFEAIAVEDTKDQALHKNFLEFFFARMGTYNALATMAGGLIGGLIGQSNIVLPFYFSAGLMGATLILMIACLPKDRVVLPRYQVLNVRARVKIVLAKMARHNRDAWRFSLSSESIRQFFLLQIMIQFAIQPMLHYWQPYFQSLSAGATTKTLGFIFFAYVGTQLIFSGVVSRLFEKDHASSDTVNFWTSALSVVCFAVMLITKNFGFAVLAFLVMQGTLGVLRNNLSAGFNRFMDDTDRATILSAVSFISRAGMLANLAILNLTVGRIPIAWIYSTSVVGMFIVTLLVVRWNRQLVACEVGNEI